MKICENCGNTHDGLFASGRFCCRSCSCAFGSKSKTLDKVSCSQCGKLLKPHGLKVHLWRAHGDGIGFNSFKNSHRLTKTSWNKGKTKETDIRIKHISDKMKNNPKCDGRANTKEKEIIRKQNISKTMIIRNIGGYRKGSGVGKQGRYKNIWCDSSWELAWVIYHLDHKIQFERNNERFKYFYDDKIHSYTPDFKINDNFIEIKGYMTPRVQAKIDQFSGILIVLKEKEMNPYIEYVIATYGKDFIKLYEKL